MKKHNYYIFKVIIIYIILAATAQAYTLDSSSSHPSKIFKCQASTIYANLSDFVAVTDANVIMDNNQGGDDLNYTMNDLGGGQWRYIFGNDNTTRWGNYSLSFRIVDAAGPHTNTTSSYVFVYSDDCTGSDISNISIGIGNYTNRLMNNNANPILYTAQPYVDYWDFVPGLFYILLVFLLVSVTYIKNQHIGAPLLVGVIMVGELVTFYIVPPEVKLWIGVVMAASIVAILWKVFKS